MAVAMVNSMDIAITTTLTATAKATTMATIPIPTTLLTVISNSKFNN